jgi:2-polyprenyl-6-methoxyphenol hydroxylase-like FAD-dependent oxidoreductase
MNTGIGDAENLSFKLALIIQSRAGAAFLDTYQAERRTLAAAVLDRAKQEGALAEDADTSLLLDMMAGAAIYHVLIKPGQPDTADIRRYLTQLAKQAGLRLP